MEKLLVICGPTATGKTNLALYLAKKFKGEVVSADSRQVYKHLNIGTGKDLPPDAKWHRAKFSIGFYETGGVRIWGYDLVEPDKNFSVYQYLNITRRVKKDILKRGKLPILTGGTGFYIKAMVDGLETSSVPRNEILRKTLKVKNIQEQFELLAQLDPVRAASLNMSDRKNSRRLVRAIEIAEYKVKTKDKNKIHDSRFKTYELDVLFIGLSSSTAVLGGKIERRIKKRLKEGIEQEINKLFTKGITFKNQSMQALGYRQWQDYFQKKSTRKEVIDRWIRAEKQYTRRQIAWFKRDKRINWFDISKPKWRECVEKKVRKWYKMADA